MMDRDSWLQPPEPELKQDIAIAVQDGETLVGYGRRQHGLNGKDTDLDPSGQCVVRRCDILDPIGADNLVLKIQLHQYATICGPTDDDNDDRNRAMAENAEFVVMNYGGYNGIYTGNCGEPEWTFSNDVDVSVPITVEEYDEGPTEDVVGNIVDRAMLEINKRGGEVRRFEAFAKRINRDMDRISRMTDKELGIGNDNA